MSSDQPLTLLNLPNDIICGELLARLGPLDKLRLTQSCKSIRDCIRGETSYKRVMGQLAIVLSDRSKPPRLAELKHDSDKRHALALYIRPHGNSWTVELEMQVLGWLAQHCRAFNEITILPEAALEDFYMVGGRWETHGFSQFIGSTLQYLTAASYTGPLSLALPQEDIAYKGLFGELETWRMPLSISIGTWTMRNYPKLLEDLQRLPSLTSLEVANLDPTRLTTESVAETLSCFRPPPSLTRLILYSDSESVGLSFKSFEHLADRLAVLGLQSKQPPKDLATFRNLTNLVELDLCGLKSTEPTTLSDLSHLNALTRLTALRIILNECGGVRGPLLEDPEARRDKSRLFDVGCLPQLKLPKLRLCVFIFVMRRLYRGSRLLFRPGEILAGCPELQEFGLRLDAADGHADFGRAGNHLVMNVDPLLEALPNIQGLHFAALNIRTVFSMTKLPTLFKLRSLIVSGAGGAQIWGLNGYLGGPFGHKSELRVPPVPLTMEGVSPPGLVLGKYSNLMASAELLPRIQDLSVNDHSASGVVQPHGDHPGADSDDESLDGEGPEGDEEDDEDEEEMSDSEDEGDPEADWEEMEAALLNGQIQAAQAMQAQLVVQPMGGALDDDDGEIIVVEDD